LSILSKKLKTQEKNRKGISIVNEEIILWEEQQKHNKAVSSIQQTLELQLSQREALIQQINEQLSLANETISIANQKYKEMVEYNKKFISDNELLKTKIEQLNNLLEEQKSISKIKIDSIEKKYKLVQSINID